MTTPKGYVETITDVDALPVLIAIGEVALVSKLQPSEVGAKTLIVLRSGERVMVGTSYDAVVERLNEERGK